VSAEGQARGEGDDHQRDVVELARAIGTAVEDDRGGKEEQANGECDTRLDQAHAPTTGRAMAETNCFSLPIFAHGCDIGEASRSTKLVTIKPSGPTVSWTSSQMRSVDATALGLRRQDYIALAKAVADG
jgi:hypothetical protein